LSLKISSQLLDPGAYYEVAHYRPTALLLGFVITIHEYPQISVLYSL